MFLISIILFTLFATSFANDTSSANATSHLTDALVECSDKNPLDSCLLDLVNGMRPLFLTGIPYLDIPVLEPLSISNITLNVADAAFVAVLSNVQIRGLSKFVTKDLAYDRKNKLLKLTFSYPEFRATGKYKITGKIFSLPIEGSGPFWTILANVTAEVTQFMAIIKNPIDNSEMMEVADQHFDMSFSKMRMRLNNLFNGDPILGETVNNFINENQQELFNGYKTDIFKQIGGMVKSILNASVNTFPIEKFLNEKNI